MSLKELQELKISAGFAEEDERYLRLAGQVLSDQTKQLVDHWRNKIIASIPNLSRHSRTPEGEAIPIIRRRAASVSSNGFWTRVSGPTIRTGSITNRKLLCDTRV